GVGVGGTAGRLVKPGERERGAETPASRALLLCDAQCGFEGFLRGGGIGRIAAEQTFAAKKIGKGQIATIVDLTRASQRFVDSLKRAVLAHPLRLELGEEHDMEPSPSALISDPVRQYQAEFFRFGGCTIEARPSRGRTQLRPAAPKRHSMFRAQTFEGLSCAQGGCGVAAQKCKVGFRI